ncbi:MAG: hypothetical protein KYX62_08600 [Pseudomonadota bacterium]|nr:hypothetical protein [Pseudomonadota bacterium]
MNTITNYRMNTAPVDESLSGTQEYGQIAPLFWDVFWVPGSLPVDGSTGRNNMVILRNRQELTLINPVRLSEKEEKQLERLGTVSHIIRLGDEPSADEAWYRRRYSAQLWALPGQVDKPRHQVLRAHTNLPVPDAELFIFSATSRPEAALLLKRHQLLLTNRALQNFSGWHGLSLMQQLSMRIKGFHKGLNIVKPWLRQAERRGASLETDFNHLSHLNFDALLGAQGDPLPYDAQLQMCEQLNQLY